jgi:hypothetical protein
MGAAEMWEEATSEHLHRDAEPRALVVLPQRIAWSEALQFPAGWVLDLPRAVELALHVPGVLGVVRASRTKDVLVGAYAAGEIAFDAAEWRAIVEGVQSDRIWPQDFRAFCERKRDEPELSLTAEIALAGAQPDRGEQWTLARVLRRIGAEVIAIDVE